MHLFFSEEANGYRRNERVRWVALGYLRLLRALLHADRGLREQLARCFNCGIRFLTARSNRKRQDLRCPFGCRALHRRQESNRRSLQYYQTKEGKQKKKQHNARRKKSSNDWMESSGRPCEPARRPSWQFEIIQTVGLFLSGTQLTQALIIQALDEQLHWILRQHSLSKWDE